MSLREELPHNQFNTGFKRCYKFNIYRVLRFTRRTKGIRKSFSGKLQNFIFLGSSTLPVCAMNLSRISISIGISLKRSLGLSTSGLYLVMKA